MNDELRIRDRDGVRTLELDRPATKNSLSPEINRRLIDALAEAERDSSVRCVVLAGAGGAFCSGLDLRILTGLKHDPKTLETNMRELFHGLIRAIRALPKPVVAVVDGPAFGFGCDLALACDLRIASERASFCEVFVKRGLMPDGGATYMLPRLIGLGKALELMLLGDAVDAAEALRLGLVSEVAKVDELAARVERWTTRLAAASPLVVSRIKDAVYKGIGGSLDDALERECAGQLEILQSKDFDEGLTAYLEKRPPRFTGA